MKIIWNFLFAFVIVSCTTSSDYESIVSHKQQNNELKPRSSFSAIWDICRLTSESNNTFRATQLNCENGTITYFDFTPNCGSPQCIDDGSGTLSSQASVTISISGSFTYNSGTCTLHLPDGYRYTIRQITGSCITHGFNWNSCNCTGSPNGDIYIKSQVQPSCPPYITNTTCIQVSSY